MTMKDSARYREVLENPGSWSTEGLGLESRLLPSSLLYVLFQNADQSRWAQQRSQAVVLADLDLASILPVQAM